MPNGDDSSVAEHAPRFRQHRLPAIQTAQQMHHKDNVENQAGKWKILAIGLQKRGLRSEFPQHFERQIDAGVQIAGLDKRPPNTPGAGA